MEIKIFYRRKGVVLSIQEKKGTEIKNNGMGGFGGLLFRFSTSGFLGMHSGVRGGGKCPEEEHTTCSGGPTIIIVTSAVYGEREFRMRIKIKYYFILKK